MTYDGYSCFNVQLDSGVAHVNMNYPPLNLLDEKMSEEFDRLARALEADQTIRVIILQSALPDFFIAHSGMARVGSAPVSTTKTRAFRQTQVIGERLRNMPKVVIAKVEGRARGSGNEIAMAADMCFASIEKGVFGNPEAAMGLVPGGGGTQRLPRLVGRARALEVLLGCEDFSAEQAERYGWINRALPAADLGPFVDALARRIASFPPHSIAHVKAAVDQGAFHNLSEGLLTEAQQGDLSVASEVTRKRIAAGMKLGIETVEVELDLPSVLPKLPPVADEVAP